MSCWYGDTWDETTTPRDSQAETLPNSKAHMGEHIGQPRHGVYYLKTAGQKPFSLMTSSFLSYIYAYILYARLERISEEFKCDEGLLHNYLFYNYVRFSVNFVTAINKADY